MSVILNCSTVKELRALRPNCLVGQITEAEVIHILTLCDAYWKHSGDPRRPHATLTSGNCSDGFVNTLSAIRYTNLCDLLTYELYKKLLTVYQGPVDWTPGSDHAGAAISQSVGRLFNAQHDFTEKGPDKMQFWQRFTILPDEIVLQVEELMTTLLTMIAVRAGIRAGNDGPVRFAPYALTVVQRSKVREIEDTKILHLVDLSDINVWEPDECPLCAAGSKPLKPKKNWAELTAA